MHFNKGEKVNKMMKSIAVVGSGFSGAVIARELAEAGFKVTVFDERDHVAGNCHTERDPKTGILVHVYGPHIFHTSDEYVWKYMQNFDEMVPFINRVKTQYNKQVYPLPINLMTINSFFKKNLNPTQAIEFMNDISSKDISVPRNFEEQALKYVGHEMYEAFFKGYTEKQWGVNPKELPASILKRLPIRFNYDDNYYSSKYQGIPRNGYTYIINKILNHKNIHLNLCSKFLRSQRHIYDHVFYSGPIDGWFEFKLGSLRYRTLDFVKERHFGDYQGTAVMNYGDREIPYTRISEHKHFAPWEEHSDTIIYKEYSRSCEITDIPYYPVRLLEDKALLQKYVALVQNEANVTFVGRLGTYRYLDMHVTIREAIDAAQKFLQVSKQGSKMPQFCVDVI
jgi:UDP-galactopyranose mutase